MIVVGIIGGIASGKTFVGRAFSRFGAQRIDADRLGHLVLNDRETKNSIRNAWGESVFDQYENVDRSKLAEIVFENHSELHRLEQITHPKIESLIIDALKVVSDECPVVLLDAPVLVKAGWHRHCHKILFVECPWDIRLQRARARGWSESMLRKREAAQAPLDEKRSLATDFIVNDHETDIEAQVRKLWNSWGIAIT